MFGHSVNVTFYTMLVDVEVAPMVLNTYPLTVLILCSFCNTNTSYVSKTCDTREDIHPKTSKI